MNEKFTSAVLSMNELLSMEYPRVEFVKTGTQIDKITGGFALRSMNVILGSSGAGKSMVAMHLGALLSHDYKILYISLENDIADDLERYNQIPSEYEKVDSNFYYYSQTLSELNIKLVCNELKQLIKSSEYDIIIIDAAELMLQTQDEGSAMFKTGKDFMASLHAAQKNDGPIIILTWQMNRSGISDSLSKVDLSSVSMSLGIAQYASSVWAVGKTKESHTIDWRMKLLKSRHKADWENSEFSMLFNNELNLKSAVNITNEEFNKFNAELQKSIGKKKKI